MKRLYLMMPLKPLLTFAWLYVVRFGFLDGAAGYRFCLLRACHEAHRRQGHGGRAALLVERRADERPRRRLGRLGRGSALV